MLKLVQTLGIWYVRQLLVKSFVIAIHPYVVKKHNNFESTLIIFKVNWYSSFLPIFFHKKYDISNQINSFVFMENPKSIHELCLNSFIKNAASHATSFLLCIDRFEMKKVQPFLLFFVGNSCLLSLRMLVWNKFPLQRRTFHCTFDF